MTDARSGRSKGSDTSPLAAPPADSVPGSGPRPSPPVDDPAAPPDGGLDGIVDPERATEVDAARRRATPAAVGEWRPPVQRHDTTDSFGPDPAGTNGMRYGGGLTALATLTIIDTTEPLVDDPDGAALRPAAHDHQAVTSNGSTASGAVSRNGLASVPMTVASPATSNGRLWRQIERSPWDAPEESRLTPAASCGSRCAAAPTATRPTTSTTTRSTVAAAGIDDAWSPRSSWRSR